MTNEELRALIAERLAEFYRRRLQRLETLKLKEILRRKNPYLFKAIGTTSATEIVEGILSAYLSSSDEGIFGDVFFEPIAKMVSGGVVAPSEGVDIAIETEFVYKAIAIKSGPNPFNSSQGKRQDDEFRTLRSRLLKLKKQFDPILGHAYGRKSNRASEAKLYRHLAGQEFWEELTGDSDFYLKLVRLMETVVIQKHRREYEEAWDVAVNRYVREFTTTFCDEHGNVQWEALVKFNSGKP
ncbi:MAG: PmeII family type II restriction endonuclease [Nitrososphaera sp.]